MVSTASLISATAIAVAGCLTTQVQGHGYMYNPLTEFKGGKATGDWVVQIPPQFDADWDSVKYGHELSVMYAKAAKAAGYTNIRKLLDSDTSLYGEDCGYSDPNAKPKNPPTDGTATFERGLAHPGPCEIWLDDKMVLHNDDCAQAFSIADYMSIKSKFKPVDYSSCSSSGCMFRFYWLAFQLGPNSKSKYSWQIYKNCIPLTGPAAGQTSTFASNTTQSADESSAGSSTTKTPAANPPASGDQTPQAPTSTDAPETQASESAADTPAPETQASEDTLAPETQASESAADTPAPKTQASESAADTPAPITPTTTENCKAPQKKRA